MESVDSTLAAPSLARRRILLVLELLDMGGAERQAVLLASGLRERHGAACSLVGLGDPGPVLDQCAAVSVPAQALGLRWTPSRRSILTNIVQFGVAARRHRPEAIVAFTTVPNVIVPSARPLTGARANLWFQHDAGLYRAPPRLERHAVRRTDLFLANGCASSDFLVNVLGIEKVRVRIVPNGVALPAPRDGPSTWRERLGLPPQAFLAVMIANIHHHKDHATLLDAWAIVRRDWPDPDRPPFLVLAGRVHDESAALVERACRPPLAPTVLVPGYVEDVAGLLSACDLGVLISHTEGLPNGVLEPMAAGLAIVATDLPGTREALGPDADALTVPPGDAPALASLLLALARDPDRRSALGSRLALRARDVFHPDEAVRRLARAVVEALGSRR
jgi:glycosyltransferase involved in cell wall biosynthesis